MITHIVLFWLDPQSGPQADDLLQASQSLKAIPEVMNFRAGPPVASPREVVDDSFAIALAMDFAGDAELDTYQNHPLHQAFVQEHVRGKVKRLLVYDIRS